MNRLTFHLKTSDKGVIEQICFEVGVVFLT